MKARLDDNEKEPRHIVDKHTLLIQFFWEHQGTPRSFVGSKFVSPVGTNPSVSRMKACSRTDQTAANDPNPKMDVPVFSWE